jgi:FtsP/CotA-like multicopper oxidase with cupredoxin domain
MRRLFWKLSADLAAITFGVLICGAAPARAATYDLVLERRAINITGRNSTAMLINGELPGPVLRFREGEEAVVNVTNQASSKPALISI